MTARFAFTEEAETQILEIVDYLAGEKANPQPFGSGMRFTTLWANWLRGRASATPVRI